MSWQSQIFNEVMRGIAIFFPQRAAMNMKLMRKGFEIFAKTCTFVQQPTYFEALKIGQFSAEWIYANQDTPWVLLYLHGGGYVMGSAKTHHGLLSRLAHALPVKILAINYRLAPEHPFPAALEDSLQAYAWLLKSISPQQIIIGGDSAGAGLAVSCLVALKEQRDPLPAAGFCFSPWVDLALQGESVKFNATKDSLIKKSSVIQAISLYLNNVDPFNYLASPVYADLTGLPPLFIQTSDTELLFSEAVQLAEKAKSAGVDVTLEIWNNLPHGWQFFSDYLPEGRRAILHFKTFLNKIIFKNK